MHFPRCFCRCWYCFCAVEGICVPIFKGNALQAWCLLMLCSYFREECVCQCFGGSVFGVVTVCAGVIVVVFWQGWDFCEALTEQL